MYENVHAVGLANFAGFISVNVYLATQQYLVRSGPTGVLVYSLALSFMEEGGQSKNK